MKARDPSTQNGRTLTAGFSIVIDAHAHVGSVWPELRVTPSVTESIRMMDRCGIEKVCTFLSRHLRSDFREGNRLTRRIRDEFPDRIIGFCVADPRHPQQSVQELDHYLGEEGFAGVKFHISHTGVPYDDPRYHEIYTKASEYQVPILAHAFSPGTVRAFLKAAKRFSDVPFIVGHSGGYQWSDCIDDITAVPNAYFDLCCSCVDAGRVESFVAAAGAQRVLLGTDLPFHAPALELSKLLYSRITRQEKALILGGNIRRILGDRL